MNSFTYVIGKNDDAPKILDMATGFFGSLNQSVPMHRNTALHGQLRWAELLCALGWKAWPTGYDGIAGDGRVPSLDAIANRIVESACPEEGDPHPKRARYVLADITVPNDPLVGRIRFITPGDVGIYLGVYRDGLSVHLQVHFNRDSPFDSRCVAGRLYEATGGTPEAGKILAEAAWIPVAVPAYNPSPEGPAGDRMPGYGLATLGL